MNESKRLLSSTGIFLLCGLPFFGLAATGCKPQPTREVEVNADAAAAAARLDAPAIVFRGFRLIDGSGGPPIEDAFLEIQGEHVRGVGPIDKAATPPSVRVVDLGGKTIVPGLVSDHSHLGVTDGTSASVENESRMNILRQLAQYEAYGVTTVVSLGLNGPILAELEPALHHGTLQGADAFNADRGIGVREGAPPVDAGTPALYRVTTPDQAVAAVRDTALRHPDLVKIWVDDFHGSLPHKMAPEVYKAAIAEAHRLGLRVAAHVYYLEDAKTLVEDGVDILAHGIRDRPVDDATVALLRSKRVWYVPTLGLDEASYVYAEAPPWTHDAFFRHALQPALAAELDDPAWRASVLGNAKKLKADKDSLAVNLANLKRLHDAGVLIGFGTDSGATPLRIAGFAEHRELALMVQAGLTPVEAIHVATSQAAQLLRLRDRGLLTPGMLADFVIVDGDPSKNVEDMSRIVEVWHRGQKVAGAVETHAP
jgi:imidazolonepropionase-like amidohydrolase